MIRAKFRGTPAGLTAVEVSGHAGFADYGEDIVCASVTSAVQLVANAVTEVLRVPADVSAGEDTVCITLRNPRPEAVRLLEALRLHLDLLAETYPDHLTVFITDA